VEVIKPWTRNLGTPAVWLEQILLYLASVSLSVNPDHLWGPLQYKPSTDLCPRYQDGHQASEREGGGMDCRSSQIGALVNSWPWGGSQAVSWAITLALGQV
jgi:hypothetical protein